MANYRGFVSYSHKDGDFGSALHKRLEQWTVPKPLRGRNNGSARLGRFFRDREELSANEQLNAQIRAALAESQSLIVVCSLNSAKSSWVANEIETFRSLHPDGQIFSVIADGEPPDCFPAGIVVGETIAADFRSHADGTEDGFLKLAAGLLGSGLADVKDREAAAQRARLRQSRAIAAGFAGIAVIAMAGLATAGFFAWRLQNLAAAAIETSGRISDEAITLNLNGEISQGGVRKLLEFSNGRLEDLKEYGLLKSELNRRIAWTNTRFSHLAIMAKDGSAALERAKLAHELIAGDVSYNGMMIASNALVAQSQALSLLGRDDEALIEAESAAAAATAFAGAFPDRYESRLSVSENLAQLADAKLALGRAEEALEHRGEAIRLLQGILKEFPNSATFPMRIAENYEAMGQIASQNADWVRAAPWFEEAVASRQRFQAYQNDKAFFVTLAQTAKEAARANFNLGKSAESIRFMEVAVDAATQLQSQWPGHPAIDEDLSRTTAMLAAVRNGQNPFDGKFEAQSAADTSQGMVGALLSRAQAKLGEGDAFAESGKPRQAYLAHLEAAELLDRALVAAPDNREALETRAIAKLLAGASAVDAGMLTEARGLLSDARAGFDRLALDDPDDARFVQMRSIAEQTLQGLD